ncbi:MAG TPA: hypothetical protein VKC56_00890 [Gallionellaceae bacterium]|nr:hypothetical protein [Gallionellaceae bacterium]
MKFPLIIVYMIVALNITMFTIFLQADLLILHSMVLKVICWIATVASWALAYYKRHTFIQLF